MIDALGIERCGRFYTEEVCVEGARTGFRLVTLDGQAGLIADAHSHSSIRVGKYGVDLHCLESVGVLAIYRAIETKPFVVIDEIGPMQLFSERFKQAVMDALHCSRVLVGTIVLRHIPWVDDLKRQKGLRVCELTTANRDTIIQSLTCTLKAVANDSPEIGLCEASLSKCRAIGDSEYMETSGASERPQLTTMNVVDAWKQSEDKLRILLIMTSPIDEHERVKPIHEVDEIIFQLTLLKVPAALIRLNPPTWSTLQTVLHRCPFDIIHFIGHARMDALQLEKRDGTADWISADDVVTLFRDTKAKLVVLNNCGSENLGDRLVSESVPAVVATSRRIDSEAAVLLSSTLYSALASGRTLKAAVELANAAIIRESKHAGNILVTALGVGADQPVFATPLGEGEPLFFRCEPPNNLPPSHDTFFDRVPDLLLIYRHLMRQNSVFIGITGLPGSGKSTVAINAARQYGWRFSRGIAYASLRKMRPFSLSELLAHLSWGLDEVPLNKQRDVALYELGRGQVLLILDDLDEVPVGECQEIIDLLQAWDTSLNGRALLIMRYRQPIFDTLVQTHWVSLSDLPDPAALELLEDRLGGKEVATTKLGQNLTKVPELCYRNPKLLTDIASALDIGIPWEELATQLRRLMGTGPIAQMEQVLEMVIKQVQLASPMAGQFLDCWPVFADATIEDAWRFVLAGGKIAQDDPRWLLQNSALQAILRANILQRFPMENGYQCRIHPLVSEYLKSHRWQRLSPEKRLKYQQHHLTFYYETILAGEQDFPVILEWDNVLLALTNASKAEQWAELASLCRVLVGSSNALLFKKNLWHYAKRVLNFALQASQQLSDLKGQAVFLHNLGISHYRSAEYQEAQRSFERSLLLSNQVGDEDLSIDTTLEIGRVYYRLTNYTRAEQRFEHVRSVSQIKGDRKRTADAGHELGRLAYRQEKFEVARQLLNEALEIRALLNDTLGIAQTLHELARVVHETKSWDEAHALYQKSLALRKQIGDLVGQQATIHQLGALAFDQGKYQRAGEYFDRCGELSEALNDQFWIAHNQFWNARLLWRLNQHKEALEQAEDSLKRCSALGISLKGVVETWVNSPH